MMAGTWVAAKLMDEARPSIITNTTGLPNWQIFLSNSSCLPGKSNEVRDLSSLTVSSFPPNTITVTSAPFAASMASSIICASWAALGNSRTSLSGKWGSMMSHPFL